MILLAEDDLSTRQFLTGALEKAGHNVVACEDGLAALEAFEAATGRFDLLLTDIVMPGMDGIELAKRATALTPELKVVYITGFAGMALGASGDGSRVIAKPFHLGSLTREIEEILKQP